MMLHPQCIDISETAKAFAEEMRRGLMGGPSSLMMLKTYLTAPERERLRGRAVAVDIGGTNLRAVLAQVQNGKADILREAITAVPGRGEHLTKEAFFDAVARHIIPVSEGGDALGVAFSHSAEILPNLDGRILSLSKEIRVSGIEGAEVCREIQAALGRLRAHVPARCVLLNDATAVALAAAEEAEGENVIGLVLGTGMNLSCYDGGAGMFINTEAAGFNVFPRGEVDALLDAGTATPGEHLLEKATAGRYIGDLVLTALRLAAQEELFSPGINESEPAVSTLTADSVSAFLAGKGEGDVLRALCGTPEDEKAVTAIIEAILERAARLITAAVMGVLIHTGVGAHPQRPAALSLEGSMILRMHTLRPRVEALLRCETEKLGRSCTTIAAQDAVIRGAALAALMD
jgi:hexokinase